MQSMPLPTRVYLPATWRCAKIDDALGIGQNVVLLVQLDQLEGGTGTVTVLLRHEVELIETPLGVLFLLSWHGSSLSRLLSNK